ncbi:UbiX family flavin prenyltransferase [Methanococcoides alaskense]|uniref:Flavin prenyltransferase UbiX n=1 Tax=Methanococcoides alaskense TaxID=325778 RepID=A0AA90TXT6_9EURY|nr:UbiX family flavin prenyltransferase [Methanococcoides alaskense]MDA0525020.1 UbiX family flavin prenyltransferase [Methanococcoides alaskense]MDR6222063.1 4-hydroxy-3-polyprenylbenzoate decarboxylase [Methanococcoides alaskense]
MEIVIGISGASGAQYGIRLLEVLSEMDIDTHLVLTEAAKKILAVETDYTPEDIEDMATAVYDEKDFTAPIASGSHPFEGMIIAPCSMKTLASVANGTSDNLIARTADVCLKERRKLVLMTRETPLSGIHIENMLRAHNAGAILLPACPGFYNRPTTMEELIDFMAGRALDLMKIENSIYRRWK